MAIGRKPVKKAPPGKGKSASEILQDLRNAIPTKGIEYRERSLAIHGMICAKCGKEFTYESRHLLTVHHIDGNHLNNPLDGSNWENLCIYCHEDEHSRDILGEYLSAKG